MSKKKLFLILAGLVIIVVAFISYVTSGSIATGSSKTPATPTHVTLTVTGDHTQVTYNDGYRATTIKGPFTTTLQLQDGRNYTITSLNIKPGDSKCSIKIGSRTVSSAKALGQYNTAMCAIVQDRSTHQWIATSA